MEGNKDFIVLEEDRKDLIIIEEKPNDEVEQEKKDTIEKKEANEMNDLNKLSSLDSILKGNEDLKIFENQKSVEKEEKQAENKEKEKNTTNSVTYKNLYSDNIEDSKNKPLLSDILNPSEEKKKDEKKEEGAKKKEMKKFLTDSYLKASDKGKSSLEDRKDRMSKRLNMAKKHAKIKEEENKFRKSESIAMRASYLENKLNIGVDVNKPNTFEKIKEENEDN